MSSVKKDHFFFVQYVTSYYCMCGVTNVDFAWTKT